MFRLLKPVFHSFILVSDCILILDKVITETLAALSNLKLKMTAKHYLPGVYLKEFQVCSPIQKSRKQPNKYLPHVFWGKESVGHLSAGKSEIVAYLPPRPL